MKVRQNRRLLKKIAARMQREDILMLTDKPHTLKVIAPMQLARILMQKERIQKLKQLEATPKDTEQLQQQILNTFKVNITKKILVRHILLVVVEDIRTALDNG